MCIACAPPAQARETVLLAFGDSLTEGHGLPPEDSFPARLEERLRAEGMNVRVVNAGVGGDTTSGGLTRLEWTLDMQKPDRVILALGANDMLRGTDPKVTRANLGKMLDILRRRDIPVLLAGMKSFRNLGPFFGDAFQDMYEDLAEEYGAVHYPFFLKGVAMETQYNRDDGLHPNAAGVKIMVDNILPRVKDLLEKERD